MRTSMFKKAARLLRENKVIFISKGKDKIFYEVKSSKPDTPNYSIILFYEDFTFKHSCTCYHTAVRDNPDLICSHKLAVFTHMAMKEFNKFEPKYAFDNSDRLVEVGHEIGGSDEISH